MSYKVTGGPAFPNATISGKMSMTENGMTIRDYFAAHAPVTLQDARDICCYREADEGWSDTERAAAMAVLTMMRFEYADAMLKAREAKP